MIKRSASDIARLSGGRLLAGDADRIAAGVSTDTRADLSGKLFVPLVGENFDAHHFIAQAVEKGAAAALWQTGRPLPEAGLPPAFALIEVEDTLLGLQRLAAGYREDLDVRVVGVTGSNGKTSTKDMLTAVLSERYRVQKTLGNLNNHIGLPLMLLSLEKETEVAVLEMGMSNFEEIALLASLAKPEIGVITNIGEAHIEYLGSRGGIADAKCELIEALPESGRAILFGDEPLLRERADKTQAPIAWFGFGEGNDVQAVEVENNGVAGSSFSIKGHEIRFTLPVPGEHQVGNALAAIAVGQALGMELPQIERGLAKAKLTARRLEVKPTRIGGMLIDDSYNASPTSTRAALKMLAEMPNPVKIAVLGGMLELGQDSQAMHREIGAYAAELGLHHLVCVGELAQDIAAGARDRGMAGVHETLEKSDAVSMVEQLLKQNSQLPQGEAVILVKASNGIKLDEVVRELT